MGGGGTKENKKEKVKKKIIMDQTALAQGWCISRTCYLKQ